MVVEALREHYDQLAVKSGYYKKINRYYYNLLYKQYRFYIPEGKKVLEIGCGAGYLLNALKPSAGVGVDLSPNMVEAARKKFPHLHFYAGQHQDIGGDDKFDYIVLSGVLGEIEDIQVFLSGLHRFCHKDTRIVIEYYSYLWQYLLKLAEKVRLKIPQRTQNWITHHDIANFLNLSGHEPIKLERCVLCPVFIPIVSHILNRYVAKLPLINPLALIHFIVARPVWADHQQYSVSMVVPCRNEKGNIEEVITRTPMFGTHQEFIFVEGHSKDGTYEEIERVMKCHPEKDIKLFRQPGMGKGDAVHHGFSRAQGDILMILDADLTVPPEEMPKFYEAIRSNKGEFINGSRLVYPKEKESMRFLNLVANKSFGLFFTWLLGQRFKDTLCGTKVISRRNYQELIAHKAYFGDFDPFGDFDLIFGAVKMNLKVIEVPVHYKARHYGTSQIQRFRHGLLLVKMCSFALRKIKFI